MNEKIKWFFKYYGSDILYFDAVNGIDPHFTMRCNENSLFKISSTIKNPSWRLILKELSDITEEDLKELNSLRDSSILWVIDHFNMDGVVDHLRYYEIDFLRSKGYAIGISKEYYITEKELK